MRSDADELFDRILQLSPRQWDAIALRARELGVGGARWEEAWLAAGRGHRYAMAAQSRAISAGASPIAAAALAGAVAAQRARAQITAEHYATLVEPAVELIGPGRPERAIILALSAP